jgi:hypothetical protein
MLAELDNLAARKQTSSKKLEDYLADIAKTCKRLGRTQQQQLEHAIQGLRPDIKRQVLLQQPTSLEDVRRIGTLCESISAMEQELVTVAAASSDMDARLDAQARQIEQLKSQLAAANRGQSRGNKSHRYGPYQRSNRGCGGPNRGAGPNRGTGPHRGVGSGGSNRGPTRAGPKRDDDNNNCEWCGRLHSSKWGACPACNKVRF